MSDTSSNGGSRWFMIGALAVMVLGLAWSGWQWSQSKKAAASPAPNAPAAAPGATPRTDPAGGEPAAPAPSEAPGAKNEVLIG